MVTFALIQITLEWFMSRQSNPLRSFRTGVIPLIYEAIQSYPIHHYSDIQRRVVPTAESLRLAADVDRWQHYAYSVHRLPDVGHIFNSSFCVRWQSVSGGSCTCLERYRCFVIRLVSPVTEMYLSQSSFTDVARPFFEAAGMFLVKVCRPLFCEISWHHESVRSQFYLHKTSAFWQFYR